MGWGGSGQNIEVNPFCGSIGSLLPRGLFPKQRPLNSPVTRSDNHFLTSRSIVIGGQAAALALAAAALE